MHDREYNDSALLESLVEDIREFTDGMESSEGKGEYCIRKVRDSIRHGHILRADLRGHCLELTVNEWPVHMFLREGFLQDGFPRDDFPRKGLPEEGMDTSHRNPHQDLQSQVQISSLHQCPTCVQVKELSTTASEQAQ